MYDGEKKQVTKTYARDATLPAFILLLAGIEHLDAKQLEEDYFVKPVAEEQVEGRDTYCLQVIPKGNKKETHARYDLWVEQKTYLPVRTRVYLPGETVLATIEYQEVNAGVADEVFTVLVPADVNVVDRTAE